MGEMILVGGPNGSGKSAYAETIIRHTTGPRYYIATLMPVGDSDQARIEKHRRQRQDMQFTTLELPYDLERAEIPSDGVVLLEDASNLLGNGIFCHGAQMEQVLAQVENLSKRCALLVVVTIEGLEEGAYQGETAEFIAALNALNGHLAHQAQVVVEMRGGEPVLRKGALHVAD